MTSLPPNLRRDRAASSLAFFLTDAAVSLNQETVAWLQQTAAAEGADSARICLHNGTADPFHQMVIVQRRGVYCRPHKHLSKAESCQIIAGELAFIVFDDNGRITGISELGRGDVIGRAAIGQYHMVYPRSAWCTYHEAKPGPFLGPEDSLFPDWAPAADDIEARTRFLAGIGEALKRSAMAPPP